MRIGIIQFPGSNCERETILAIKRAGMEPVPFLWNQDPQQLRSLDGYVIVGGFSYEDRSRAGIIAALDPVMQEIKMQSESGKPILGICNGAQILVESGLVPGCENNKLAMALTDNKRMADGKVLGTGYYNAWVSMRLSNDYQRNAFTSHLTPNDILHVPIAHAEGRFVMSPALLQEVMVHGLGVFQYCDAEGQVIDQFPVNPNGSIMNFAAISNKAGNVLAMMPHPERTDKADAIFHSMRDYIAAGRSETSDTLSYYPRHAALPTYHQKNDAVADKNAVKKPSEQPIAKTIERECLVELMITDNHAVTVQQTLRQLGFPVTVKRYAHWQIVCDAEHTLSTLKASGVLFNPRKELEVSSPIKTDNSLNLLVRAHEDWQGQQKMQLLTDHFDLPGIQHLQFGLLWVVTADQGSITEIEKAILNTHIFFNPYAHDCYYYQSNVS